MKDFGFIFDGITHFDMFWKRFDYFFKMSVCDKDFVVSVALERIHRIS